MSYISVNEIEKFAFDDCVLTEIKISETGINMVLEALIVKRNNSQNTNYTESYAGTTSVRLVNGELLECIKDGYKYYDANEVLKSEKPDYVLNEEETKALIPTLQGAYLYSFDKDKEENGKLHYTICVEFIDETENTMADSYRLNVSFDSAEFRWEHYMNRVQN